MEHKSPIALEELDEILDEILDETQEDIDQSIRELEEINKNRLRECLNRIK